MNDDYDVCCSGDDCVCSILNFQSKNIYQNVQYVSNFTINKVVISLKLFMFAIGFTFLFLN